MQRSLLSALTATVACSALASAKPLAKRADVAAVSEVNDAVVINDKGTYGRTTVLDDGSIMVGFSNSNSSIEQILTATSSNDGKSWKKGIVVYDRPAGPYNLDNADPISLGDGHILMSYREHSVKSGSGSDETYSRFRLSVSESKDNGKTWDKISEIANRNATQDPDLKNGLWEPFFRKAKDGKLQAYFSGELSKSDQDNLVKTSSDNGTTWDDLVTVSGKNKEGRDGMVGVSKAADGKLIVVFETTVTGKFSIQYVMSDNDGATWGDRGSVYEAPKGRQAGAPQVVYIGDTLVASFMEGDDGGTVNGGATKLVTSKDSGKTWSDATVVHGDGSHWPGLHQLDDERFLALYSIDGQGLVSHEFKVE